MGFSRRRPPGGFRLLDRYMRPPCSQEKRSPRWLRPFGHFKNLYLPPIPPNHGQALGVPALLYWSVLSHSQLWLPSVIEVRPVSAAGTPTSAQLD